MDNQTVADVFSEMADLLHIRGGDPHRIRSFRRTARVVETLPEPAATMITHGTLDQVPGLGPGSVRRIKDILRTGTCDDHRQLRAELPDGLRDMLDVKGLGAATIRLIWSHLRIGTIDELEYAARSGALLRLPRMGEGTTARILKGIEDWRQRVGKFPYVEARRAGLLVVEALRDAPEIERVVLSGSVRRGKAEIGDLDVLVASDDGLAVTSRFLTLPWIGEVLMQGGGRASARLHSRQQIDLRVLPRANWGAGLHYFTGSALHNIAVRARGLQVAGIKISDKGIFVRDSEVLIDPGREEEDIFAAVGLPWIPPEIRENTGEIEAAVAGRLPRLVVAEDLHGDLHTHTLASDGKGSAREMVDAAAALGHRYLAITDHTQSLEVANGLDEARLAAQVRHLREVEQQAGSLRLLCGTEVDILRDGSLDLDPDLLRQLDWVIGSLHSDLDLPGSVQTDRLIRAMETGLVDCIGHPTNRRLGHRKGSELEFDRLLREARRFDVALEVNGNPYRMDLPDTLCRQAKEAGVPVALNTDAHAPGHLKYQEFGLVTARRGWLEPADILNCRPWAELADRRRDRMRRKGISLAGLRLPAPSDRLYADHAAATEHWPDLAPEPTEATPPTPEPAPAAPPDDPAALEAALRAGPDDDLRQRLDDWMRNGGDPALEDALTRIGPNAMQAAFGLLYG